MMRRRSLHRSTAFCVVDPVWHTTDMHCRRPRSQTAKTTSSVELLEHHTTTICRRSTVFLSDLSFHYFLSVVVARSHFHTCSSEYLILCPPDTGQFFFIILLITSQEWGLLTGRVDRQTIIHTHIGVSGNVIHRHAVTQCDWGST